MYYQYAVTLVPILFLATAKGIKHSTQKLKNPALVLPLCIFVLLNSLSVGWLYYRSPVTRFLAKDYRIEANHKAELEGILKKIPSQDSVMASDMVIPHIAHRPYIFRITSDHLDPQNTWGIKPDNVIFDRLLPFVYQTEGLDQFIGQYRQNPEYELVYHSNIIFWFRKIGPKL